MGWITDSFVPFLGGLFPTPPPLVVQEHVVPSRTHGRFLPIFSRVPVPPPAAHPALPCLVLALLTSSQPPPRGGEPCRSLLSPPLGQTPKSPNPTRIVPSGCKWRGLASVPPRVGIGCWGSPLQPSPSCCRMGRAGGEDGKGESRGLGWGFSPPHCAPRATPGCSRTSGDGAGGTEPVPRFFGEKRHKKELQK